MSDRVEIENALSPGRMVRVDRARYDAMRAAYLSALPAATPGVTAAEAKRRLLPHLPEDLFPGGAKAGWWLKAVQLDLEAKGLVRREGTKPLRFHRA